MVDNPLSQACQREIERRVKRLIEGYPRRPGPYMLSFEIPYIGGDLYAQKFDDIKRQVTLALLARERFRHDAPPWWKQPLPLREGECAYLQQSTNNREKLVGYYGRSLRRLLWDYDTHPSFPIFARGAVYSPFFPAEREEIRQLAHEFPPAYLPGLDGDMVWRG